MISLDPLPDWPFNSLCCGAYGLPECEALIASVALPQCTSAIRHVVFAAGADGLAFLLNGSHLAICTSRWLWRPVSAMPVSRPGTRSIYPHRLHSWPHRHTCSYVLIIMKGSMQRLPGTCKHTGPRALPTTSKNSVAAGQ